MLRVMRLTFDICHDSFYYYNCYDIDWRNNKMKKKDAGRFCCKMDRRKQKMMEDRKEFQKELLQIAVPVTLQCVMQSSFSVADQIMTGKLGSNINFFGIS